MKSLLSVATGLLCLLFLNGCIKNLLPKKDNVCDQIQNIKISGAKASYYTGDPIQLSTDDISDTYYSWRQTNAVNEISTTNGVSVSRPIPYLWPPRIAAFISSPIPGKYMYRM
jgi:hypothetical protein